MDSNDAYGSQTLKFQRAAKSLIFHSMILSDLHARFEHKNNFQNAFLRDFMTESDK